MKKFRLVPIEEHDTQQVGAGVQQVAAGMPQVVTGVPQQQHQPGITEAHILSAIPVTYRNKARTLLDCITRSSQLTWNERGEITLGGHTIQGSHIIDLLKYTLYPYKHFTPVGFDQFQSTLAEINIPRSLITQQTGRGQLLPPPGLPRLEKKAIKKSAWVWHKMS